MPLSTGKEMHNLKVENYVLSGGLNEDLSPGYSLLDSSEGLFQRRNGGTKLYKSCCKNSNKNKR